MWKLFNIEKVIIILDPESGVSNIEKKVQESRLFYPREAYIILWNLW